MKRLILTLTFSIGLLSPLMMNVSQVSAAEVFNNCGQGHVGQNAPDVCRDVNNPKIKNGNTGTNNPIVHVIDAAINVISYLIGVAAVIGIVVSGIRLTASGGDSNAIASARSGLIYSLVGLAVAVLAQVLVAYVLDKVQ